MQILIDTAKSYLMLAKSLKEQGLDYKHYVVAAKKAALEASKYDLSNVVQMHDYREMEVTAVIDMVA